MRRGARLVLAGLVSAAFVAGAATGAPQRIRVLGHGAWSWFADPRAVELDGPYYEATFIGWIDWTGAVRIEAYDPRFGSVGEATVGHLFHDDHGAPAILVEPDHRLTVFWSGHDGSRMYYRTTTGPEEIRHWGRRQEVAAHLPGRRGYTYPNPVLLSAENDRLYLFWRGTDWSADFATRTLSGRWGGARRLIRVHRERPYLKVDSNGTDTIAFAFTNGHPRNVLTSVYYAAYRHGSLWGASGRWIGLLDRGPITPARADLVYDARRTHTPGWVWDVALGAGHPVIVYATFPRHGRNAYWYARWEGHRWRSHELALAGPTISPGTIETEYVGGITLDHADPSIVYVSLPSGRGYAIQRWVTRDGGAKWRHTTVVRADGADNLRPVVPRDADGATPGLVWMHGHYGSYTKYRTSIEYAG